MSSENCPNHLSFIALTKKIQLLAQLGFSVLRITIATVVAKEFLPQSSIHLSHQEDQITML
jgi:hypothetical protein